MRSKEEILKDVEYCMCGGSCCVCSKYDLDRCDCDTELGEEVIELIKSYEEKLTRPAITEDDLEVEYSMGMKEAWEIAIKLGELALKGEMWEIFDEAKVYDVLKKYTPQDAKKKIEAYEESKKICVGDVVECDGVVAIVLDEIVYLGTDMFYIFNENRCVEQVTAEHLTKTDKNIDLNVLFKQIG